MAARGPWPGLCLLLLLAACGDDAPDAPAPSPAASAPVLPAAPVREPAPPLKTRRPERTRAEELLARYDANPDDVGVRDELGRHGLPVAVKLLARLAEEEDAAVRAYAFRGLQAIINLSDPKHHGRLIRLGLPVRILIEEGDAEVVRYAWRLLSILPEEASSGAPILQALRHDEASVRLYGIRMVKRLGGYAPEGAEQALRGLKKSDPDAHVRLLAKSTLRKLAGDRTEGEEFEPPEVWCPGGRGLVPARPPPVPDDVLIDLEELLRRMKDRKGK